MDEQPDLSRVWPRSINFGEPRRTERAIIKTNRCSLVKVAKWKFHGASRKKAAHSSLFAGRFIEPAESKGCSEFLVSRSQLGYMHSETYI